MGEELTRMKIAPVLHAQVIVANCREGPGAPWRDYRRVYIYFHLRMNDCRNKKKNSLLVSLKSGSSKQREQLKTVPAGKHDISYFHC